MLIDIYTNHNVTTIVIITVSVITIMVAVKTIRNIIASPFVVVLDRASGYFDIPTMWKTSVRKLIYLSAWTFRKNIIKQFKVIKLRF